MVGCIVITMKDPENESNNINKSNNINEITHVNDETRDSEKTKDTSDNVKNINDVIKS